MGVEVVPSEVAEVHVEDVTEAENGKPDNDSELKQSVKFGSHEEVPVKGEGNDAADANFPKDAVDEWPAPKQIYSFYFVRYRPYDDPKIKAKIDLADKEVQKRNQSRFQINEELKAKRVDRAELVQQVRALKNENYQYKTILDEKKKEIEPLQQALGKLRNTNAVGRGSLCSSEEELNDLIYSLHYRIQHESIPLTEEKQILREIKQLEGTRGKVITNAAMRAKIQDSLGEKEAIQDQVKLMGSNLDEVRKDQQAVWAKITRLEDKVKALDDDIKSLKDELNGVTQQRDKAYESIQELRKQRDEGNVHFYQSRMVLNKAKELAAKKDVKALEEFVHTEVEKFMSLWSNNKAFREDYEKRILPSLDMRQLSKDGRIRNPDEKPLAVMETSVASEPEPVAKANLKLPKEDPKPALQKDTLPSQKAQKETSKQDSKPTSEHIDIADEVVPAVDKVQKTQSPAEKEMDEAKAKEMKREEEIAKAKLAMERKKKLAEKAAAKAAMRAQKEAQKKSKEREKKLKKRAATSTPDADPGTESVEPADSVAEAGEPESVEVKDEGPVSLKEKVRKENTIRSRNRPRNPDSLPKAILRRKKTTNYWLWIAPAALLAVVLALLGYYYPMLKKQN